MGKKRARQTRTIVTPTLVDLGEGGGSLVADGKLSFWKMILPQTTIQYTDDESGEKRTLDFNRDCLTDLAEAFDDKALDQTAFQLADKDNAHTMDAERYRGEVSRMALDDSLPPAVRAQFAEHFGGAVPKGLFAKLDFASKKAAKAVLRNPRLGVSARIREDIEKVDGRRFKRAIIHVLGTLDPKVTGMGAWLPAVDLSEYASGQTIDLSQQTYSVEVPVSKSKGKASKTSSAPKIEDVDPDDIADWDDTTLAAFLDEYGHLADASGDDNDDESDEDETDDEGAEDKTLVGAGANLSNAARRAIDLANSAARTAQRSARKALTHSAKAEWRAESEELLGDGVPPYIVDLAEPALRGAEDAVIDLSETGGQKGVNVTKIIRDLVDGYRGTIDMSEREQGHGGGSGNGDADPDATVREQFAKITADL